MRKKDATFLVLGSEKMLLPWTPLLLLAVNEREEEG